MTTHTIQLSTDEVRHLLDLLSVTTTPGRGGEDGSGIEYELLNKLSKVPGMHMHKAPPLAFVQVDEFVSGDEDQDSSLIRIVFTGDKINPRI